MTYDERVAAFKARILPAAWSAVTFDRIYGIPAENTSATVVLYNKELFAKYKLDVPKTVPLASSSRAASISGSFR